MNHQPTFSTYARRNLSMTRLMQPIVILGFYLETFLAGLGYYRATRLSQPIAIELSCIASIALIMGTTLLIYHCRHGRALSAGGRWHTQRRTEFDPRADEGNLQPENSVGQIGNKRETFDQSVKQRKSPQGPKPPQV